jgi:hypothetical protein
MGNFSHYHPANPCQSLHPPFVNSGCAPRDGKWSFSPPSTTALAKPCAFFACGRRNTRKAAAAPGGRLGCGGWPVDAGGCSGDFGAGGKWRRHGGPRFLAELKWIGISMLGGWSSSHFPKQTSCCWLSARFFCDSIPHCRQILIPKSYVYCILIFYW